MPRSCRRASQGNIGVKSLKALKSERFELPKWGWLIKEDLKAVDYSDMSTSIPICEGSQPFRTFERFTYVK